jgi:hypothetical protein
MLCRSNAKPPSPATTFLGGLLALDLGSSSRQN